MFSYATILTGNPYWLIKTVVFENHYYYTIIATLGTEVAATLPIQCPLFTDVQHPLHRCSA